MKKNIFQFFLLGLICSFINCAKQQQIQDYVNSLSLRTVGTDTGVTNFYDFSAATMGSNTILLTWSLSTNTALSNTSFEICQNTSSGGCNAFSPTYTTATGVVRYLVTGLPTNTTYYFKLRAKDAAGNFSTVSTEVHARAVGTPTWVQQAYLKAPNAEANDSFGSAVAISGDTVVVGAFGESSNQTTVANIGALPTPSTDNDSAPSAGAAYIFVRNAAGNWSQQAYLKAPNAETNDLIGNTNAVAISGDTVVVGTYLEDSGQTTVSNSGSLPTPGTDDDSTTNAGAAYVFVRSGTIWSQQAYLKAPNAESNDLFGGSVAISGDTVVVGAIFEDSNQTTISNSGSLPTPGTDNDSITDAGAAYVFVRSGTIWSQQAYLKAPNAEANDSFGYSVAISGDTIIVGANQEDSNQTTVANTGSLPTPTGDNDSSTNAGAAYVFVRDGNGNWSQQAYLKASDAAANDNFGNSVAISGDSVVSGAPQGSGAAYVFTRDSSGNWSQQSLLTASNAEGLDFFGFSVAISGDSIVTGGWGEASNQATVSNSGSLPTPASDNDSAANAGAAYVFVRDGSGNWSQQAYLKAPNAEANDQLGRTIAISGDTVVVGASSEDSNQTSVSNSGSLPTPGGDNDSLNSAGAAYIFVRQ